MEQRSITPWRRLSVQEIRGVYRAGEAAVTALVESLQGRIGHWEHQAQSLEARVSELEARLAQNSRNSHQPPSRDGFDKPNPRSLRRKSGRKPGGQPGHVGRTLQPVAKPDHTVPHRLERCPCGRCGGCWLRDQPVLRYEKRQVFELPKQPLVVTEHQAEVKVCPRSGLEVRAEFPAGVVAPVQYGPRFQSLMVYLNQQQLIPSERLAQLCEDLFGQPLSEATLQAANERAAAHLGKFEQRLVRGLVQAALVHLDESGVRVAGKLHWLHVASTDKLTFYGVHPQRGTPALEAFDIVPRCPNWVMHDYWAPYFTSAHCLHALCNQHLLRELKFLAEEQQELWAGDLSRYLRHLQRRVQAQGPLDQSPYTAALTRFRALLRRGRQGHPRRVGRDRQSKGANLLDRLESCAPYHLAFLWNPVVPFTNNQAEQDIRMIKGVASVNVCSRQKPGTRGANHPLVATARDCR